MIWHIIVIKNIENAKMDHFDYTRKFQEEQFDDVSRESYNIVDVSHNKHGDELLIDLVRSRPYLYDKTYREYKDMNIKENAWKEMAGILNITGKLIILNICLLMFFISQSI